MKAIGKTMIFMIFIDLHGIPEIFEDFTCFFFDFHGFP
tara:strand:- start:608 stop:721 length:114 start_codon:yes stop_codon:yes gene_type:complete